MWTWRRLFGTWSRRDLVRALTASALAGGVTPYAWETAWAAPPERGENSRRETAMTTKTSDTEIDAGFAAAREQVRLALAAMGSGDPEPYINAWAEIADVTLFGAWGPIEHGHQALVDTFRWVGGRFSGGALVPEDTVVYQSGDLAYTVGFERGEVSVDGGETRPMTLRVTHVYRWVDDVWRLVHRHADFPPADQRLGAR